MAQDKNNKGTEAASIPASVIKAMNSHFGDANEIKAEHIHELINVYECCRHADDRIFIAYYGEFIVFAYYASDDEIAIRTE